MDTKNKDEPKIKKARKRSKIKCLDCGSVFDDDYLSRHEKTIHDGKKVRTILDGVPEDQNPFSLAKKYASKKNEQTESSSSKFEPPKSNEHITSEAVKSTIPDDVTCDLQIETSSNSQEGISVMNKNVETIQTLPTPCGSSDSTSRNAETETSEFDENSWAACAGKLIYLTNLLEECRSLVPRSDDNDSNPILFLTKSLDAVKNIEEKAREYIKSSESMLNTYLEKFGNLQKEMNNDDFIPHDPAYRPQKLTDNQKFFIISLGAHRPILNRYPVNDEIKNPKKQRSFSSKWYDEYPHLEYSIGKDAAFCFVCYLFPSGPDRTFAKDAWNVNGVRLWHKMQSRGTEKPGKLKEHFNSTAHKAALSDFCHFIIPSHHIDSRLLNISNEEVRRSQMLKEFNTEAITILTDTARTLSRQGLPFRGRDDDKNGNFHQIVKLIGRHNPVMGKWLNDGRLKAYSTLYMSSKSQNEFIDLLSSQVIETIINEVNESGMFSIMADTTPDLSHKDQLSVVVRYVNADGSPKERVLDLLTVTDKTGAGLASTILDSLNSNRIKTDNLLFQSYDYANSMSGLSKGTQKKLSDLLNRNIPYVPCQAHRLNIFVEHSCNASSIISNMFNTLESLYVFFSSSTKRFNLFKTKTEDVENFLQLTNLSKTRWIARAQSLRSVWISYEKIIVILDEILEGDFDSKTKGSALTLQKAIMNFDFVVSVMFMRHIMYKCQTLTEALESVDLNVIDAASLIESTITSLEMILSSNDEIKNLIQSSIIFSEKNNLNPEQDFAKHHRRRLKPKRFDDNAENAATFSLEMFYSKEFKEVLNVLIMECKENLKNFIKVIEPLFEIFKQPFERNNMNSENISNMIKLVPNCKFQDVDLIMAELEILADFCKETTTLGEVIKISEERKQILPIANYFCRLVVSAPFSVCSNERSFSPLKFVKSALRTNMSDQRTKSLLILTIEKDLVDKANIKKVVDIWSKLKNRKIKI